MLEISESVINSIIQDTESCTVEQGFILGCRSRLDRIDVCEQVPAVRAGLYFYSPDTGAATETVRRWADQEICFCGFIHSHRTDKREFSEPDIEFAERLLANFRMPYLWFGLLVITEKKKEILFYKVYSKDGKAILETAGYYRKSKEESYKRVNMKGQQSCGLGTNDFSRV